MKIDEDAGPISGPFGCLWYVYDRTSNLFKYRLYNKDISIYIMVRDCNFTLLQHPTCCRISNKYGAKNQGFCVLRFWEVVVAFQILLWNTWVISTCLNVYSSCVLCPPRPSLKCILLQCLAAFVAFLSFAFNRSFFVVVFLLSSKRSLDIVYIHFASGDDL